MTKNELKEFIQFLSDHLTFKIEINEAVDICAYGKSPDEYNKLDKTYSRLLQCGNRFNDLENIKNETLFYLHGIFGQYKNSYQVFISSDIADLMEFREKFSINTEQGIEYNWHQNINLVNGGIKDDSPHNLTTDFIEEDYSKISEILELLKTAVDQILAQHESLIRSINGIMPIIKIKTTMTVGELALLFRLLYDTKKIKEENTKKNICRMISASFATDSTDDISVDNLYNKMNNPDGSSMSKVTVLLQQMKTAQVKIDE